ncbi:DNA-3-methyladenine glycosylase 2 family protein, partial [Bacillus nitratireducens]|nr:DNA-3-methyladenine glycosylase 2 family protein [Bacillus nitratireducens]
VQGVFQSDDKTDDAFLEKVKQACEPYCTYAALYAGKSKE